MSFQLPHSSPQLQAPGKLFIQPAYQPIPPQAQQSQPQSILQAPPQTQLSQPAVLKPDQSRFSMVSRLVGAMPGIMIPLAPLSLPSLTSLRKLPGQVLNGLERGWQSLKDTFTFQFEETGRLGTSREAEANCGPASASMVLKQFGIVSPSMQQLRRTVGAPIGSSGGAFALTAQQVAEAVKKTASQKGRYISYDIKGLGTNVDTVLNEMRRRLAQGEKLILLTSGLNSLSRGHYMVINEVRPDGSIMMDDPGRSKGENVVHTKAQLARALSARVHTHGLGNSLISFKA